MKLATTNALLVSEKHFQLCSFHMNEELNTLHFTRFDIKIFLPREGKKPIKNQQRKMLKL